MNVSFQSSYQGQLIENEPMDRHCSWRTGGTADWFYEPLDKQDLLAFLDGIDSGMDITFLGLGSNTLVRDGGVRGVVIGSLNRLNEIKVDESGLVYAECGVTCSKLARFCQKQNLAGADFLAGIPGTVGGALAMNAGAFGSETWQFVESVEMINRQGVISQHNADQFTVGYRSVELQRDQWFSAGVFNFPPNQGQTSNIKPLLEKRNATQPIGLPSCGSVFMNPPGDHAARLIEAAGLKGYCLGGACVSDKHANFIINSDQASASDIEDLILYVQAHVKQQFSIMLHTEVRILGERP